MEFFKAYEEMKDGKIFKCEDESVVYRVVQVTKLWNEQIEEFWELQSKYSYSKKWNYDHATSKLMNGEWMEVQNDV